MIADILVFDVGSTYTKASAFSMKEGVLSFLGRGQAPTTLEWISEGADQALRGILDQGIEVTPETKRYSSCSAAGGLRMVAMGYMPRVTAKAAKEVAMTAGARIMEVISHEEPPAFRMEVLQEIKPDIILLAGGTDSGDETSVMENTEVICGVRGKATVILACNKTAQREAAMKFEAAGIHYVRVPNIMPTIHELNVKPAREAIHEHFINQITQAKGLSEFKETLADRTVVPTPGAVLLASELLAKGTHEQEGIGGLILVDVGGATTDIHSALPELEDLKIEERGLVINNEKQFSYRTVEGNLGMRVSATGVPEAVGARAVIRAMDQEYEDMTPREILDYTEKLECDTQYVPESEKESCMERALAACAIDVALRRHAGTYAKENDPIMGIMAGTALGRDLRNVRNVMCAGGIFVYGDRKKSIRMVKRCFERPGISLLPLRDPEIMMDEDYILYAAGVLGKYYPDETLTFLKKYVKNKRRG